MVTAKDVKALLKKGIDPDDVKEHLKQIGVSDLQADELIRSAAGASAAPPAPLRRVVAPEHTHFVTNAAAMLRDGTLESEVGLDLRRLGFDAEQAAALLAAARDLNNG